VLGLITSDITNPYCSELTIAVENAALAQGHSLLLGNAMNSDERQARHLRTFMEHQVRGILFIGSTSESEESRPRTRAAFEGNNTPVVRLDRPATERGSMAILVDNRGGGFAATTHLLDHGYDSVACFSGPTSLYGVTERTDGWRDALRARGHEPGEQLIVESAFDRYDAFAVAQRMFANDRVPRAIFVHSDEQAYGIMSAATQAGLTIPDDLALIAFDGLKESSIVLPGLTSVQQPFEEAARLAVELLLEGGHDGDSPTKNVVLPLALTVRQSCGSH
jgi:LacI family transcriptional regulator